MFKGGGFLYRRYRRRRKHDADFKLKCFVYYQKEVLYTKFHHSRTKIGRSRALQSFTGIYRFYR